MTAKSTAQLSELLVSLWDEYRETFSNDTSFITEDIVDDDNASILLYMATSSRVLLEETKKHAAAIGDSRILTTESKEHSTVSSDDEQASASTVTLTDSEHETVTQVVQAYRQGEKADANLSILEFEGPFSFMGPIYALQESVNKRFESDVLIEPAEIATKYLRAMFPIERETQTFDPTTPAMSRIKSLAQQLAMAALSHKENKTASSRLLSWLVFNGPGSVQQTSQAQVSIDEVIIMMSSRRGDIAKIILDTWLYSEYSDAWLNSETDLDQAQILILVALPLIRARFPCFLAKQAHDALEKARDRLEGGLPDWLLTAWEHERGNANELAEELENLDHAFGLFRLWNFEFEDYFSSSETTQYSSSISHFVTWVRRKHGGAFPADSDCAKMLFLDLCFFNNYSPWTSTTEGSPGDLDLALRLGSSKSYLAYAFWDIDTDRNEPTFGYDDSDSSLAEVYWREAIKLTYEEGLPEFANALLAIFVLHIGMAKSPERVNWLNISELISIGAGHPGYKLVKDAIASVAEAKIFAYRKETRLIQAAMEAISQSNPVSLRLAPSIRRESHRDHWRSPETDREWEGLIQGGETEFVEFKSTYGYDLRNEKRSKALEYSVSRAVAGMLNSRGGIVLIGVSDDGEILGLEHDLKGERIDRLRQKIDNHFSACLTPNAHQLITVREKIMSGTTILAIEVERSSHAVFHRGEAPSTEELFVRRSASTVPLSGRELLHHCRTWFG